MLLVAIEEAAWREKKRSCRWQPSAAGSIGWRMSRGRQTGARWPSGKYIIIDIMDDTDYALGYA